jgi:hypothetical protein
LEKICLFEIGFNTLVPPPRWQPEMATLLFPLLACVQVKALPILIEGDMGGQITFSLFKLRGKTHKKYKRKHAF